MNATMPSGSGMALAPDWTTAGSTKEADSCVIGEMIDLVVGCSNCLPV